MSIGLVDTTILCNVIRIPGMDSEHGNVLAQLRDYLEQNYTLLLPVATIIETGNHIAQCGNGNQRREAATRFVNLVSKAIEEHIPWTIPKPLFSQDDLAKYLQEFPDNAMRGIGLGDLSIIREFHRQCDLLPFRHIFIWTLDDHLSGYEHNPPEWAALM